MSRMLKPMKKLLFLFVFFQLSLSTPVLRTSKNPVIIEGDIVYSKNIEQLIATSKSAAGKKIQKRKVIRGVIHYWKDGILPYTMAPDLSDVIRRNIRLAFRQLQNKTCIKFIPRTSAHNDYISFVNEKGCFSSIGRQGGKQRLSLGKGCESTSKVLHEILHALGFFHEHSRYDRDRYLKVLWWNITPGKERNFNTYSHDRMDDLGFPYDLTSLMQYDNKAFSANGQDTLEKLGDPSLRFGRQQKMSSVDVQQLRELYKCRQPHSSQSVRCSDKLPGCDNYSLRSDACESNVKFMDKFCKKSCAFCDM